MARHIKRAARHLGADLVGIAPTHPNFMYASGKRYSRYLQEGTAEDAKDQLLSALEHSQHIVVKRGATTLTLPAAPPSNTAQAPPAATPAQQLNNIAKSIPSH